MTAQSRISGVVAKRARTAIDLTGRAWLLLDIEQGRPGGLLCHVRRNYGHGHEAQHAAGQAASRMKRGAAVTVYVNTLSVQTKRNRTELLLDDADFIELASRPIHHATAEKDTD